MVFTAREYNGNPPPQLLSHSHNGGEHDDGKSSHVTHYYREYAIASPVEASESFAKTSTKMTPSSSSVSGEDARMKQQRKGGDEIDHGELSWKNVGSCKSSKGSSSSSSSSSLGDLCRYYLWAMPRRVFADLFLPVGYPSSIGKSYLQYQFYDSLQGLCSYLRGVVSTSAVLTAAGVGDKDATAISAAMTWAMRDGLGMVGGLLFSYIASCQFDSYVKEFRLFADVINDVGLTLDMLAPYVASGGSSVRILMVSAMAQLCRVACGMAAGATKGSITQHFAIRGNMADLNAKESTQETLVSLIGMILGIALARYLHHLEGGGSTANGVGDEGDDAWESTSDGRHAAAVVSWSIFIFLTIVHVWANYAGVKLLRLRTMNRERAKVAFHKLFDKCKTHCIHSFRSKKNDSFAPSDAVLGAIYQPDEVNESLLSSTSDLLFPSNIRLGVRLSESLQFLTGEDILHYVQDEFRAEKYIMTIVPSSTNRFNVCVTLRVGATDSDELKAFVHAMITRLCLDDEAVSIGNKTHTSQGVELKELIRITHYCVDSLFGDLNDQDPSSSKSLRSLSLQELSKIGWDVDHRLYLGFGPWRAELDNLKVD